MIFVSKHIESPKGIQWLTTKRGQALIMGVKIDI